MSFYSTTGNAATTAAETAKTAAEAAKTAAEAAQAATEILHDDFDDRYLGSKASDPTVDNDGNALAAGTMYFNTTTTKIRVYSGSAWADITAVQGALITGNNLSDLTDDGAARTNLGLGTAATTAATAYATAAQADQTVALTGGTGITTSGTYPNFTIANSSPDLTVGLTGAGATTVSGTYPNFTITSTNTTYNVANGGLTEVNFTSALNTKLAGIETNADVTDTANVVAALTAGSNVAIAGDGTISSSSSITYQNSWVDSGNNALLRLTPSTGSAQDITLAAGSNVTLTPSGSTLTIASTDTTYNVTDGQLSQNNFTNTDHAKLNAIEDQADVTDTANVTAAGAVMKTLFSAGTFIYSTSSNNPEEKNASEVRTILNVADGANNYVHPVHDGDDIDIDTGGLSGATVVSDLDFNVTTDTLGHVVDANAVVATRNLTLANLGYTGSSDATTNDTDANLKNRANHTGSQAISTVTGLQGALDAKQPNVTFGIGNTNAVKINSADVADDDFAKFTATGLEGRTAAEMRTDLNVANGATNNDTDANLKNRANHSGTQAISTVSGLQTSLDSKSGNDTDANLKNRANHTGTQGQSTIDNLVSDLAGKQAALTHGIANTNSVKVDGSAASGNYTKFTSSGIQGVSLSALSADLALSKSTTPTLSTTGFRITISNWSSYSSPTVQLTGDGFQPNYTQSGAVLFIKNAGIGAHKVYVQINESGKISSETAAASLTLPTYRYYKITFEPGAGGAGSIVNDIKFYTGAGQTGTAYPTNMTSNTTPSPFVASQSGSSYSAHSVFDGNTGSIGWWGGGAGSDFLQIDMGSNVQILSLKMNFYSIYFPERITVHGSRLGTFSGEEVVLFEMAGLFGGSDLNVG